MRLVPILTAAAVLVALTQPATSQAALQRAPALTVAPSTALAPPARFSPLSLSGGEARRFRTMRSARMDFACNPVVCVCRGDMDCNDMFETNVCGGRAICIGSFCYCDRPVARRAP